MATLAQLTQKVIVRISQVPGTGTQLYAEDRIGQMIQELFDFIFKSYWWPQFRYVNTFNLDGVNGLIVGNIANNIKSYDDIRYIHFSDQANPLAELPDNYNSARITGNRARLFQAHADPTKVFQIFPKESQGTVTITGRTRPADFLPSSEIPFDSTALILGATRDYLEDDAANPGAINKFEQMFEARIKQLKSSLNAHPRSLDPRIGSTQDEWTEC